MATRFTRPALIFIILVVAAAVGQILREYAFGLSNNVWANLMHSLAMSDAPIWPICARTLLILAVGIIAIALVVMRPQIIQNSRSLSLAAEAAAKVAQGNLEIRLPEAGVPEMRTLAKSFNHMIAELTEHRTHLSNMVAVRTNDLRVAREDQALLTAQLRAAYEASREGIIVIGKDRRLIAANGIVHSFFGTSAGEAWDTTAWLERISQCFHDPELFRTQWTRFTNNDENTGIFELETSKPERRILCVYTAPVIMENGVVIARLWTFRDITEHRKLEEGLQQARKMEAIGRLAGGVAHDFNNLLTGIMGNIELIENEAPNLPEEGRSERITLALQAGQRATKIVNQLLGFSRKSRLTLTVCRVPVLISELESIARSSIDRNIGFNTSIAPDTWPVWIDPGQIEQVLMNLFVNARDAMPEGGMIDVSSCNLSLREDQAALMTEGKPGDFVRITVTDTGTGMPPEIIARVFEPFFTTKDAGKGTGLGLATSFGIVQQHGGWISIDSHVDFGTTFHVYLPRYMGDMEMEEVALTPTTGPVLGGRETVLLVDDEDVVRAVAEGVLRKYGYNVLLASDGEEALAILGRMDGAIDLVVLDLTMPRLSGRETFAMMRRGNARNIPVIICSGYPVDIDIFTAETGARPDAIIQKPYPLMGLATTVRTVLDSQVGATV